MASSAHPYGDDDALLRAVRELMLARRSLTFALARDDTHSWWWTAFLPARSTAETTARPVARSGHGYLRRDQCDRGTVTFVTVLNQIRAADGPPLAHLVNGG